MTKSNKKVSKWLHFVKFLTIFQCFIVLKRESLGKMHKIARFREKNLCKIFPNFYLTKFRNCGIMEVLTCACVFGPGTHFRKIMI